MQGNNQLDHRLPPRLFTTDRFPSGRLNIYSKPDLLAFIRHVLRDTLEFQFIRSSCFGKLFDLPTCQCPVSCKLTHAMLTRHLVCEDKHTFWSIFGSDPIKFGLQEFGTITGLPCGAFPVGYTTDKEDQSKAYKDPFWIKLIGKKRFTTIADLRRKLETHTCRGLLKQETFRLKGFPLALQLLAYQAVPKLQSTIPIPFDSLTIMDLIEPHLPLYPAPSISDILSVEADPDLSSNITPTTTWMGSLARCIQRDDRVSYKEQLIADHRPFNKDLWHGGDTSVPIISPPSDEDEPILERKTRKPKAPCKKVLKSKPASSKVLKPRKTSKKSDTGHKQRCISSYFHAVSSSRTSNDKILELLSGISDQISNRQKEQKLLRKLLKRKKTPTSLKRSAFHTLRDLSKKGHQSHKGCLAEPTNQKTADFSHQTSLPPMEEYHPFTHSPVVSQYAAQLYGSTSVSKSTGEPVHEQAVETPAVHTSPIHTSPVQDTTDHLVAVHNSPTHNSPINNTPIHEKTPFHPTLTTLPYLRRPSVIYDASDHPNSSEIHHILFHGKEIFDPISPDPPSLSKPKFDSLPLPFTPDTSSNKGSDSLPGFVGHATTINAFSAPTTSNPFSVANSIVPNIQDQQTEDNDIVELSVGSPAREMHIHIPSIEENFLAKEFYY
uniref:DUF1985 domain-containing protein n=1 Tax=Brassica oleracea var. oleracea TaxID=109376 RepID=A0A0D3CRK7_BRAOL